jgi:lipoprotein-releasing system ATP-binding protein
MGSETAVRVERLRKTYRSGAAELVVLAGLSLEVAPGELVAIIGPSGSGKSTLLHLLAALDTPNDGTIYFCGRSLDAMADRERAEYRNRSVGFVWQRHHLLPDFTAAENAAMPLLVNGMPRPEALARAAEWLAQVGLAERASHRTGELSGGEQQRAAIARALVTGPKLLLADEPTGDLDEGNAGAVFGLLEKLHREHGLTTVLATHNLGLVGRCHRVLRLEHGILAPHPF